MAGDVVNFMCRVCEQSSPSETFVELFEGDLAHKIQRCASVQISENDGLPQFVCNRCYYDIEIAYAFRKRCEATDIKLRDSITSVDCKTTGCNEDSSEEEDPFAFEHIACDSTIYSEPEEKHSGKSSPMKVLKTKHEKKVIKRRELKEKLKSKGKASLNPALVNSKNEISRETFMKDEAFRHKVLLPILDKGLIPKPADISFMTRVACQHIEKRINTLFLYPSTDELEMAAKKILTIFPHLEATRVNPDAPPESRFFWRSGGVKGAHHTGTIYHRVRGLLKALPPDAKKFTVPVDKRHSTKRKKFNVTPQNAGHETSSELKESQSDTSVV